MPFTSKIAVLLLFLTITASAQKTGRKGKTVVPANTAAEDISGMFSFLKDGEFVQINLENNGVSGYVSRQGDGESDRGAFLDHFFTKASVNGHDVSFTTKAIHGTWFEFKGRFDRGPAKTRAEDGYYVLHGTLTEFTTDADKKTASRSREVDFKSLAQPDDKG